MSGRRETHSLSHATSFVRVDLGNRDYAADFCCFPPLAKQRDGHSTATAIWIVVVPNRDLFSENPIYSSEIYMFDENRDLLSVE